MKWDEPRSPLGKAGMCCRRGPSSTLQSHGVHVSQRPLVMGDAVVAFGRELMLWAHMELNSSRFVGESCGSPGCVWWIRDGLGRRR